MLQTLSIFVLLTSVSCYDYSWKFTVTVAKDQPKTFAAIWIEYPDADKDSVRTVFLDEFNGGNNVTQSASFKSNAEIKSIKVKAVYAFPEGGKCPPKDGPKTLSLEQVSVRFTNGKKTYTKSTSGVKLPLACDTEPGTLVPMKDFKELSKNDCFYDGKYYEDAEEFQPDCDKACHCDNGAIGCVSRCPPFAVNPAKCNIVRSFGSCCMTSECVDDLPKQKCDTTTLSDNTRPPWAVQISSGALTCSATIINNRWILTTPTCAKDAKTTKILYPSSLSQLTIEKIVLDNPENVTKAHQVLLKVSADMNFTESLQQVNLPFNSECPKHANSSSCNYYLTPFSGESNKAFSFLKATKSDESKCAIPKDNKKPIVCVKVDKYPSCPNIEGSSVVSERSGKFYVTGFLLDSNSTRYDNGCDINTKEYRQMISVCLRLPWIRETTKK